MLICDVAAYFKDQAVSAFTNVMLYMSYGIYNMITWLYNVFVIIAKARFVTGETIQDLTSRLYLLVGIISLFLVAYSFLMVIVNPDNITKGKYATTAMVKNIILAVVTITFVPTVFNFSYAVQKSILDKDVIGRIILDKGAGQVDTGDDYLSDLSISIFETSFYLSGSTDTVNPDYVTQYDTCAAQAKTYNDIKFFSGCVSLVQEGAIEYNPLMSVIIGLFVIYVLGLYCIDMGLRAIKLVFLQIIAPIPCLLMIVPGQEKVFSSWVKEVIKTFIEVFLKILILTLGIYMIQLVTNVFANYTEEAFGPISQISVRVFVQLFIIFGILMFVNKAPKLIGDIFGIDLGYGFSLKKRMDDIKSGFNTLATPFSKAAGAVGGYFAARKAYGEGLKTGNKGSRVKSALASFHGIRNGWNGGIKNIGKAYDYELAVQDSYAHTHNRSGFIQVMSGIGDSLRDNFGFGSRYDYIKKRAELERDYKNAPRLESINNLQRAANEETAKINAQHKSYIDDNQQLYDALSKRDDIIEKDLSKVGSKISVDRKAVYSNFTKESNTFKTSYVDETGKQQDWNRYDYVEERKRLVSKYGSGHAEVKRIDKAISDYNSDYMSFLSRTEGMNWSDLEALKQRTDKDTTLTKEQRKKITNSIEAAKDYLKIAYNENTSEQSSSYKTANKEIENILKLSNTKIGLKTKLDTTTGKYVEVTNPADILDMTELNNMFSGWQTFKIKKKIGAIIDEEKMNISDALSSGKIDVDAYYFDENDLDARGNPKRKNAKDEGLSYFAINKIIKDYQGKVEDLNKSTEKLLESYVTDKENAERHKHIAGMRKNNGGKP